MVRILDHVRSASSYADGDTIYRLIVGELASGKEVTVSFEGILSVPSAFVNGAFVRLLETIPFDVVRSKLRFQDSTRQINELIRSRFEFVADASKADSPVLDGIYHVAFTAGGRRAGEGLVVVKGTTVNGGDAGFLFTGRLFGSPDDLTADLRVKRWNRGHVSIFGELSEFDLTLSGRTEPSTGGFNVAGSVRGQPTLRISIVGRYLAPAV